MRKLITAITMLWASLSMASSPVVVASKIDTEGAVLGQVIVQTLRNAGIEVENRIQLGATNIVRQALINGEIDIYPEYTGNGAFFFDQADSPVWKNAEKGYQQVRELDKAENNIIWLSPAPANNTWAISVRQDLAEQESLSSLDDLAVYVLSGGEIKLAASAEFVESQAALPAFEAAYGFDLTADQLLVLSGGNTAATMRAAALKTDGVNAAMTYGTDGGVAALGLTVLSDPAGVQPVYQPAPIIRQSVLAEHPEIEALLAPVFERLTLAELQQMNARVQVEGESPAVVVEQFLNQ